MGSVYASRRLADRMAGRDRIACVEIEIPDQAVKDFVSYETKQTGAASEVGQ
ncbi:hypothetical protein ACQR0Z_22880 [Bradyrhizobium sp. HKCCYLS3077]|uniref:hypothetical protein n=1 Tax=Bradyrhizobium sp. HKCCYLS3077 TaxID=3420761 RepID=UPI003EBAE961